MRLMIPLPKPFNRKRHCLKCEVACRVSEYCCDLQIFNGFVFHSPIRWPNCTPFSFCFSLEFSQNETNDTFFKAFQSEQTLFEIRGCFRVSKYCCESSNFLRLFFHSPTRWPNFISFSFYISLELSQNETNETFSKAFQSEMSFLEMRGCVHILWILLRT